MKAGYLRTQGSMATIPIANAPQAVFNGIAGVPCIHSNFINQRFCYIIFKITGKIINHGKGNFR